MFILHRVGRYVFYASLFSAVISPSFAVAKCEMADSSVEKGLYGLALSYYEMCTAHNPDSQDFYKLGSLYYKGLGLPHPDYSSASAFFKEAAERGHAPSMMFLGLMAMRGEGLEKPDYIEAYKWFMLAAERPENKWIYGFDTEDNPKAVDYLTNTGNSLTDADKQKAAELAGFYKEKIIMRQAEKLFAPAAFDNFKADYAKDDKSRKKALDNLKEQMSLSRQ